MDVHRVEGIKYDFDRMSDEEMQNLRGHLIDRHARLAGEIALVDSVLFARTHPELPLEHSNELTYERYIEATRDV